MIIKILSAIIFAITAIIDILAIKRGTVKIRYFTKPLLMPLLALLYVLFVEHVYALIVVALLLSFLGDVFLLKPEKKPFFMAGLISFLAGHVCYIVLFLASADYLRHVPGGLFAVIIVYCVYGIFIFNKLKSFLGPMKGPVLIYLLVIMSMSFIALARIYTASGVEFWLPFAGSLFFMLSDSVLAFQVFKSESKAGGVIVMSTYIIAQVLIVSGFII